MFGETRTAAARSRCGTGHTSHEALRMYLRTAARPGCSHSFSCVMNAVRGTFSAAKYYYDENQRLLAVA
jgi:hypothetical protein